MFSLYAKQTRDTDIERVQNVPLQTITEAGGGMADVAKYMPMFLPTGMAGKLTGPETAGLWAYATTLTAEPSMATTSLRNVFMALQGKGEPQAQEMLDQLGIRPGMGFFPQMQLLAAQQQQGKFALPEAQLLAGREGASMLLSMLQQPEAMTETISKVVEAARTPRDLTQTMIQELMGTDEIAHLEDRRRQLDVIIRNIKGQDIKAQQWDVFIKEYEKWLREIQAPEAFIKWETGWQRLRSSFGADIPEKTPRRFWPLFFEHLRDVPEWTLEELQSEGQREATEQPLPGPAPTPPPQPSPTPPPEPIAEPPIPTLQPTPTPPPESAVGGPVSINYDHRVIHQTIFNPLVGMDKQDLRIEPPYLA